MAEILRLAVTPGEPAGIGPDLCVQLAQSAQPHELVMIADPQLLCDRAQQLALPLTIRTFDPKLPVQGTAAGEICVLPIQLRTNCVAGKLSAANGHYVLDTLATATDGCLDQTFAGLITAPVHKGVINEAGIPFSGHTEFLQERCQVDQVVMMLATAKLRVALVTTHLPLADVATAITAKKLSSVCRILHQDLQRYFGLPHPRILVCGLNPHAGESGHLGREEIEVIGPTLEQLRTEGLNLIGPLPADTLYTEHHLKHADATLAMYHDQGLPVLKYQGFGQAVNITLGLPIIRTSVDHGTALDLAGTGKADLGSLQTALSYAIQMAG